MSSTTGDIWVYLATSPLSWLTLTLVAYQAGLTMHHRLGRNPLLNPVLIAIILVALLLSVTHTDYQTYFAGAQFVHFLLGPATVALAVPLWRQFALVRRSWPALTAALLAGSLTAAGSAVGIGWLLGATDATLASLAPKSATAPVAMAIAEQLGGLPTLTAVLVILTGISGAALGTAVLRLIGVRDDRAVGFAIGCTAPGFSDTS